MPMLFDRDAPSLPPSADRLPIRARLQIDVLNSGFEKYLKALFKQADEFANQIQPFEFRDSEVDLIIPEEHTDNSITFIATQGNLAAIAAQDGEHAYASITIQFNPGNIDTGFAPIMTIRGHEQTYSGPLPKSFKVDSQDLQPVQDALIQAMMRPAVNLTS